MYDLTPFIDRVRRLVANHAVSAGAYRRWTRQNPDGNRSLAVNPYGCADAANICYSIGDFPSTNAERAPWITTLQGMQNADSGMFIESTHDPIHTTAHCIAALELFEALPIYPLTELLPLTDAAAMEDFLDGLDWRQNPWNQSHLGAGLYAALVLTDSVDTVWRRRYFDWLAVNCDPATGLFRRGCVAPVLHGLLKEPSLFPHLAGTFHYLFNLEYARQPLPCPAALVDTCLHISTEDPFPLGSGVSFAEIDWVYCLTRSLRQSGHRHSECQEALTVFADRYIPYLLGLDPETHPGMDDLHRVFGTVCCLAELQAALPGRLHTDRPIKLVLDRRPFI